MNSDNRIDSWRSKTKIGRGVQGMNGNAKSMERKIIKQKPGSAEDYSGMLLHNNEKKIEREIYDASEKAKIIIAFAEKKAAERLKKVDEFIAAKMQKAQEQGFQEGLKQVVELVLKAQHYYNQMVQNCEADLIELALRIAEKIIVESIQLEPERVMNIVKSCLIQCRKQNQIILKVNPDDLEIIESRTGTMKSMLSEDCKIIFVSDDSLTRGGVILETEVGKIDARIEIQLDILATAMTEGRKGYRGAGETGKQDLKFCHCEALRSGAKQSEAIPMAKEIEGKRGDGENE